jgi:hypothetical protein
MHTDGVQEIIAVDGHMLQFQPDAALNGGNIIHSYSYNQLNPAAPIGGTAN